MIAADYVTHLKVLGKLARLWDDASSDASAMKLLIARFYDQIATGEAPSYDTLLTLNPYTSLLNGGVQNGAEAIKTVTVAAAAAYLISATFRDSLITTPATPSNSTSVLEALQTEMGAGVDNKTLTTSAATGFVNFFDANFSPTGSWNTEADGTADYKDSIYVVTTIV